MRDVLDALARLAQYFAVIHPCPIPLQSTVPSEGRKVKYSPHKFLLQVIPLSAKTSLLMGGLDVAMAAMASFHCLHIALEQNDLWNAPSLLGRPTKVACCVAAYRIVLLVFHSKVLVGNNQPCAWLAYSGHSADPSAKVERSCMDSGTSTSKSGATCSYHTPTQPVGPSHLTHAATPADAVAHTEQPSASAKDNGSRCHILRGTLKRFLSSGNELLCRLKRLIARPTPQPAAAAAGAAHTALCPDRPFSARTVHLGAAAKVGVL